MRILFSTCSGANYMAPPTLSDEQVNCGPFFRDCEIGGHYFSLETPKGDYDLAAVATKLPPHQQPEAVVCLVDASWFNTPRNLAAFKCPKVALVADTHHMSRPITGMIQYLLSQPFDRIVFLYTRHHLDLLREAGLKNLFWFPGLTFPHADGLVHAARKDERIGRIALIGQAGSLHQRRLRLAGALAAANLPLVFRETSQREAMSFYGSSLIGFNATANADLNLRYFEILASGAMLLVDQLAAASGVSDLWSDGRELVVYRDPRELVERAQHYCAHPAEARAIGAAGARWFDTHFTLARRTADFQALVCDGRAVPQFAITPPRKTLLAGFDNEARRFAGSLAVYEQLQLLHSNAERVTVLADDSVPAAFQTLGATLPRLKVVRTARPEEPVDCLALSTARALVLTELSAPRLWCWDAAPADLPALAQRFKAAGLLQPREDLAYFELPERAAAADRHANEARKALLQCDLPAALELARRSLQDNPRAIDALLIMAELALEGGNRDLYAKMVERVRALAPEEPRLALLELSARQPELRQRPADRLLAVALRHVSGRDLPQAKAAAMRALTVDPQLAGAWFWLGKIALRRAEGLTDLAQWREFGAALKHLRKAAELDDNKPEYWTELGLALHKAGHLGEAGNALQRALHLDPMDRLGWHCLGQILMAERKADDAVATLHQAIAHFPADGQLRMLWGHALKRAGRLDEAQAAYRVACGGPAFLPPRAGARRRVVFVVQHGPSWSCVESVWREFRADPAWETLVVALPYQHPFFNAVQNDRDEIFGFLERKGIPFERGERFPLTPQFAEVVFLQNPYDITRPVEWQVPRLVKLGVKLAYLPYGLEIGGGRENNTWVMNMPLQRMAWRVFARSERQRVAYADHCASGNAHVVVTGHPKLDALRGLEKVDTAELSDFAAGRRIVAWNPHFDVRFNGTAFGSGFSTFLRWHEFMLEEFARRPGLVLAIRPHPLFFATLEDRGIFTADQMKAYLARGVASRAVWVDRAASPLPLFAASHAMMSDVSSFVLEYSATGKPLLFLNNPHGPQLNDDAEFVHRYLYRADRGEQIRAFLDLVEAGMDPMASERHRAFPEFMHQPPGGVGPVVKQAVEAHLACEGVVASCEPQLVSA
jgi:tetratricopeptide (TPR) repeat protein